MDHHGRGSLKLLSREGEITSAKRIGAARNTMILGLCERPLTFQAITIWRDELLSEDILLRDVIDLETTFGHHMGAEEETPVVAAPVATESPASTGPELDADGNPIIAAQPNCVSIQHGQAGGQSCDAS